MYLTEYGRSDEGAGGRTLSRGHASRRSLPLLTGSWGDPVSISLRLSMNDEKAKELFPRASRFSICRPRKDTYNSPMSSTENPLSSAITSHLGCNNALICFRQ
ncbi:hypothetical protein MLD38_017929 [Melastoma candidum]|uniref:Uncharacterized protein n=1 Tax=Melastoma candidum TaxID=119954 RepID=A0ACB9QS58_9MYRT|nr:hypothetical protein MLD38_017929 [Melastoma candidum]